MNTEKSPDRAEFRTLCHNVGLSAQALAVLTNVPERTVRHWWATGYPPEPVLVQIWALDALCDQLAARAVALVRDRASEQGMNKNNAHRQ